MYSHRHVNTSSTLVPCHCVTVWLMTASQQTESWCHGGCSRRSAAPPPLDVSAAAAEATKAGLCKPSQAPAPALGTRYHGLGTVPCNAAVIRHYQPSLQNSYPQKSIDYGNQFQPSACNMFLIIIIRRRYKVVAEQYCKISPLICMVCLFFKL